MSLTGWAFPGLTLALTVIAFVALVVLWPRVAGRHPVQIVSRAGLLLGVNVLVLVTAFTMLNAQFLFFADWSDLTGSVTATDRATSLQRGGTANQAATRTTRGQAARADTALPPLPTHRISRTGVITYTVHGPLSGLRGQIVVQLPPGYTDPANAGQRYPVLETFPGYPSAPTQWIQTMHLERTMDQEVAAKRMTAALIVSPEVQFPAGTDTECVNGPAGRAQVETWLTQDVPNWVTHTFRVRTERSSWASIGLSAGGWCAAMAAMLHPAQYSAAIVMAGYFRPDFGPFYEPFAAGSRSAARYDLVALAHRRPPPVALWLQTSHADPLSYGSSAALLKQARRPLALNALVLQHAGHRMTLWQGLLPSSLTWLGANLPGFSYGPPSSRSAARLEAAPTGSGRTTTSAGLAVAKG